MPASPRALSRLPMRRWRRWLTTMHGGCGCPADFLHDVHVEQGRPSEPPLAGYQGDLPQQAG